MCGTRNPLKLYGNGFELLPLDGGRMNGAAIFYDENVQQAYDILHTFFSSQQIAWQKQIISSNTWLYPLFQQLQPKALKVMIAGMENKTKFMPTVRGEWINRARAFKVYINEFLSWSYT